VKQIRKQLTYANVMSSLAVFLILGGATAFAATKIGANQLKANSVKTGKIVKEAVTEGKIKNGAVTTNKIAEKAVTTAKIADNAVTTPKIADNAVTTSKINLDAVTTGRLAPEAVTTGKIANDAVTGAKVNEASLNGVVQNVTYEGTASGANSEPKNLTVDCGPGKRVLGGFYQAFDFGGDVRITVHIMRLATIGGEANRGLEVFAREALDDADIWQLTASATCATL
jgi:hypothetical protein